MSPGKLLLRGTGLGVLAASLLVLPPAGAFAQTRQNSDHDLPGVREMKPIVTRDEPTPRGAEAAQDEEGKPSFRVGDWDVRVSGSVSYQVGFGTHVPDH
jgi:hypothetical protein